MINFLLSLIRFFFNFLKLFLKLFLLIFIPALAMIYTYNSYQIPSLDREWNVDQTILPTITFSGNLVKITDLRSFEYNSTTDFKALLYDENYDLKKIESLYYIIEPFSEFDWPAHTMLSFWFSDWKYLVVSAEIRKEIWESFSALKWLVNQYELVYMLWDETDFIKLRANYRKDDVIMYPIKTTKENISKLLVSMLERADKLSKTPEFYNTIFNNCTTNIYNHVNTIRKLNNTEKISWSINTFLPSHSDENIYELWLIDTSLPLDEAREYYKINELSEKYADSKDYSKMIRKERK